jgi:hypothetical protein
LIKDQQEATLGFQAVLFTASPSGHSARSSGISSFAPFISKHGSQDFFV